MITESVGPVQYRILLSNKLLSWYSNVDSEERVRSGLSVVCLLPEENGAGLLPGYDLESRANSSAPTSPGPLPSRHREVEAAEVSGKAACAGKSGG